MRWNVQTKRMFGLVNFRSSILIAFIVVNLLALSALGVQIQNQFKEIRTAPTDNTQWNFAQLEVEFLGLQGAVHRARLASSSQLEDVRRAFDLTYSRVDNLVATSRNALLKDNQVFTQKVAGISAWINQQTEVIDGPDIDLRNQLFAMDNELTGIIEDVRDVSLQALRVFAEASDKRRSDFSTLLATVAGVSLILLISLLGAFFVLIRTYRRSEDRALTAQRASQKLQSTVGASLDAILVVDAQSRIIDYNGAAEKVFGYQRQDVIGQDMTNLMMPEKYRDMHREGMKRFLQTGEKRVVDRGLVQLEALRKDGTIFPVELSIASAEDANGAIFVSFIRDISNRVETENNMIKARDNALAAEKAKSEFIAVMSHELRNPLNGLMASLELVSDDPTTSKQARNLEIARRTSRQILSHVSDVLDISKIESGSFELREESFEPTACIREIVQNNRAAANARGNEISGDFVGVHDLVVQADLGRIHQVLLNLVGNANKFTAQGTIKVCVTSKFKTPDEVWLVFDITDTGIGIPQDRLDDVFEDFVTLDTSLARSQDGTGLGLGISRRIAGQLGGRLSAKSTLGKGSTFTFEVPVNVADQGAHKEHEAQGVQTTEQPDLSKLKVLLVEDNPLNRSVLQDLLGFYGIQADEAENGKIATQKAQGRSYELILMDVSMPVLDGIEATKIIRSAETPNTRARIVALTAYTDEETIRSCLEAGMDSVLNKPVTRADLLKTLRGHEGDCTQTEGSEEENLDLDVLSDLLEATSPDVVRNWVSLLSSDLGRFTEMLAGDPDETLPNTAHSLAGSAGILGLSALRAQLNDLEVSLKSDLLLSDTTKAGFAHCAETSLHQIEVLLDEIEI